MAIAPMKKVMIVTHRSESEALLEALQQAGTVQVLDAERAMVTKEWPELQSEFKRPRDLEDTVDRLSRAITFLKPYADQPGGGLLAPRAQVSDEEYKKVVRDQKTLELLEHVEQTQKNIDKMGQDIDGLNAEIAKLRPWTPLALPVERLGELDSSVCFAGLVPDAHFQALREELDEVGAIVEVVGPAHRATAVLVVCLNAAAAEVQKTLRQADFETTAFEGYTGRPAEIIQGLERQLAQRQADLKGEKNAAAQWARQLLSLQILHDHYKNLTERVCARDLAPSSDQAWFFEGWVKAHEYPRLEAIVAGFEASSVAVVPPGDDELPPVEIENAPAVRPFETITRLYGTPGNKDVDPTVFLAPFFAIFFGLCVTDAGYGIVLIALLAWMFKKLQGDKKAVVMMLICSVMIIVAGMITGGWFADAIPTLLPQAEGLNAVRQRMMLFDPMDNPMVFIGIALALGYIQVLFGLGIGVVNHLLHKDYAAAVFEKLTWIILLNCLILYGLGASQMLPAALGTAAGYTAILMAALIFWFTERGGSMAARLGGGAFAVFNTVFYLGDMLSYVRIMALGMVTAGLGMAANILTQLAMDIPYVGFFVGLLVFVGMHTLNIALALLGAFVHSLRLQFVEFFPKFFSGGGHQFRPLRNDYEYVSIVHNETRSQ